MGNFAEADGVVVLLYFMLINKNKYSIYINFNRVQIFILWYIDAWANC